MNGWLEDEFPFGAISAYLQGRTVSFREGIFALKNLSEIKGSTCAMCHTKSPHRTVGFWTGGPWWHEDHRLSKHACTPNMAAFCWCFHLYTCSVSVSFRCCNATYEERESLNNFGHVFFLFFIFLHLDLWNTVPDDYVRGICWNHFLTTKKHMFFFVNNSEFKVWICCCATKLDQAFLLWFVLLTLRTDYPSLQSDFITYPPQN